MTTPQLFGSLVFLLILIHWLAQWVLEQLNQKEIQRHADHIPEAYQGFIDPPAYERSVAYSLAKGRLEKIELTWNTLVLLGVLFSGLLPVTYQFGRSILGDSVWSQGGFLVVTGLILSLPSLPMDWYRQFRLEVRFGFNTTTPKLWCLDRLKGAVLGIVLGYPLIVLVLKTVEWSGDRWWLWAWICVLGFQGIMMIVAPVLIMPWFNRFTPLPAGPLRDQLLALAKNTRFPARQIEVMDGSKRSRHSNAFFTGFGRFRKIVLFDTLIQQLSETELAAVLAHEIGHYKRRHLLKLLVASAAGLWVGFYVLAWLARQEWFYAAFGFPPGQLGPALLLFSLVAGTVTFWISPLAHYWSRRYEFQADAFAARVMQTGQPLILALRKLMEKNLSNLTPHPCYSRFYYSHPTLLERERALAEAAPR